jgi:hypothetical protein
MDSTYTKSVLPLYGSLNNASQTDVINADDLVESLNGFKRNLGKSKTKKIKSLQVLYNKYDLHTKLPYIP